MTLSALSNTFFSPSFPASHPHQSKFLSFTFSSPRSQPLATQLRKTIATTPFTTFCSLDSADAPNLDTPIEFSTQFWFFLMTLGFFHFPFSYTLAFWILLLL